MLSAERRSSDLLNYFCYQNIHLLICLIIFATILSEAKTLGLVQESLPASILCLRFISESTRAVCPFNCLRSLLRVLNVVGVISSLSVHVLHAGQLLLIHFDHKLVLASLKNGSHQG